MVAPAARAGGVCDRGRTSRRSTRARRAPCRRTTIVADAAGAAFLEADAQKLSRRAPCGDTVAGTNWAEEERGKLKGDVRFGNLCACIDPKVGALGVPEIEAALGAASSGPLSVMSVVALPARRALRVSIGPMPACKGPFVDVDAGALHGQGRAVKVVLCSAPVEIR